MESHEGKSVPAVNQFQKEGTWGPVTPVKPTLPRPRPIYKDGLGHGQGGLFSQAIIKESGEYLSRFSQPNQGQTNLSSSISSAERSIPNYFHNDNNNIWDANSRINAQIENVELQRRGLEDYLPQDRIRMAPFGSANLARSSYSRFSSCGFPFSYQNNVAGENGSVVDYNATNPLAQFDNVSFGDLLAMKGPALEPSMSSTRLRDSNNAAANSSFHGWDSQPEEGTLDSNSTFRTQESIQDLNQLFDGFFGQEMLNSAFPNDLQSISNAKSTPNTMCLNGKNTAFAPPTPDLQCKAESVVTSRNTNHTTHQKPREQNGLEEHEVASAIINLQGLNDKEVSQPLTDSPDQVSVVVDENHNLDKGDNQDFDLNKTPQKKTRRRRYLPKVVSEKKPKRTPKPKTPKPTDPKEPPKTKRKYVRKNKTTTTSTTNHTGATETVDPKPTEPAVKSCRRSLNFDLNGQVIEDNSLHKSTGGSDADAQPGDCHTVGNQPTHNVHLREGEELMVETSQIGIAYDLNRSLNQELKNYTALPDQDNLESSQPDQTILTKERDPSSLLRNNTEESSRTNLAQCPNSSPCTSSNEGMKTKGSKRVRAHSSITKTTNVDAGNVAANHGAFWQRNHAFMHNADIREIPKILFPEISKKRRTDKAQKLHTSSMSSSGTTSEYLRQTVSSQNHSKVDCTASKYYCCDAATYGTDAMTNSQVEMLMRSSENQVHLSNTWIDISRLKKKKRSKGTTQANDLSPLEGTESVSPATPAAKFPHRRKSDISNTDYLGNSSRMDQFIGIHSHLEIQAETHGTAISKRKNRKQNSEVNSRKSKVKNHLELVLYNGNQSVRKNAGCIPVLPLIKTISVEAITEGLKQLDINREGHKISYQEHNALVPYCANNQEQNALVPYGNDGTLVPFEGPFDPVKKRRQRAKVDLDDETTRVWRLLLENIDNKGINGTDEEKMKWWENERGVFGGRVDSFIARMRLVQGDRRFTPWKGSVLDSVIGVFLTQNVSDHLSSSAFMAMAARFPIKSENCGSALSEEATSAFIVEPVACVIESEERIMWNDMPIDQPVSDWNSRIINVTNHTEEKEVVNSKEITRGVDYSSESSQKSADELMINKTSSYVTETEVASILGYDRARDDASSSQQSVISSQNSINSPNLQTLGAMSTFSESQPLASSSQGYYFGCSTSFMGLLKMAESPLLHNSYNRIFTQDQTAFMKHVEKDSPEAPGISSSDYLFHQKSNFHIKATTGIEVIEVESRSSDTSRKDENSTMEQSNLTTDSTVQPFLKERDCFPRSSSENMSSSYVLEGEKMIINSQKQSRKKSQDNVVSSIQGQTSSAWKSPNRPNSSQEAADVTGSTTILDRSENDQKEVEQISEQNYTSGGISEIPNAFHTKPKKRAVTDKRNAYDWDSLRKQAQVNGGKKERPANNRDSLDWEAVRRADVRVIADTIKERGMNNMLAERIKDLLDRLVEEHGSIDLEWLRDIPPDKAKEYLLSFRGLGLKSVECVRLLTLHHLAFPVDTNVGRIAVRLGWVPLQPLPESLQLHLLELYPVLESIQKYLWPRLCKLDQKTLYELHYHMITFGKVFCTKRQPNCNACPLRGECRHFASAFTSARLALPGPEEKSIMASSGGRPMHVNPPVNINLLPLPPPWSNHHPETKFGCDKDASIVEAPSTPLFLPQPQTILHLKRPSQVSTEPIVEVPASPEPEPEQEQALCDIEDTFYEDPNEIPTIELNMKEFSQTIENFVQANRELQETGMSRALVTLTPEAASIPAPKLKNISRLRTEHHVYELPDSHPLLKGLDKREPDDPCSYLLAIWTPGETANSIDPPERRCNFEDPNMLCSEETCSYCSSLREIDTQIVRGTLLIPCRTAMRGSFPLNGTYFQVNEVFADHDSSLSPIAVPRCWLWNLPRRTVYFGTSIPTIFRGLNTEDIQHCFWRGYVCVRGFDQTTRAARPLMARLHFPASRMQRGAKGKVNDE